MFKFIINILIFNFLIVSSALSQDIKVFEFTSEEFDSLKISKRKKITTYSLGSNEKGNFL